MFSEQIELRGHIIDSLILPKVLDEILTSGGSFTIRDVNVLWTKKLYPRLQADGPLTPTAIAEIHRHLATALPPA